MSQEGARFAKQNGKNSYDTAPFHEVEWSILKIKLQKTRQIIWFYFILFGALLNFIIGGLLIKSQII